MNDTEDDTARCQCLPTATEKPQKHAKKQL